VTTLIDYVEALEAELARRDEIIKRLKEDAERLASNVATIIDEDGHTWCNACKNYDKITMSILNTVPSPYTVR